METFKLITHEAYANEINIELFNDFVAFVMKAAENDILDFQRRMKEKCIWYKYTHTDVSGKYNFRYPGEMLERYEQRFGSDMKGIRALALGLAYSKPVLERNMFVGAQKANFIRRIKTIAADDFYLQTALCLLDGKKETALKKLIDAEPIKTEKLLFMLSLFDDLHNGFDAMKLELLKAFGEERSISAFHNSGLFIWFVSAFEERIKSIRKKETELFKLLLHLRDKFIAPDSPEFIKLKGYGYTTDEIVYLNYVMAGFFKISTVMKRGGIIEEKIAIEFCKRLLNSSQTHSPNTYWLLEDTMRRYEKFNIKCYDERGMIAALQDRVSVVNPATFLQVSKQIPYSFVEDYDALDEKWDMIAENLERDEYAAFFSEKLCCITSIETVHKWIDKFETLANKRYMTIFGESLVYRKTFSHLVKIGCIKLSEYFEMFCLENEANQIFLWYLTEEISKIPSRDAFLFLRWFIGKYQLSGLKTYLHIDQFHDWFLIGTSYYRNYQRIKEFKLQREFLSPGEHREVLGWIEEYIFQYAAHDYAEFATVMLRCEFLEDLYPKEELRSIYKAMAGLDQEIAGDRRLMERFLTKSELEKHDRAEEERKQKEKLAQEAQERELTAEEFHSNKQSWTALYGLSQKHYGSRRKYFYEILQSKMTDLIRSLPLSEYEALESFSKLCLGLMKREATDIKGVFDYFDLAKEAMYNEECTRKA